MFQALDWAQAINDPSGWNPGWAQGAEDQQRSLGQLQPEGEAGPAEAHLAVGRASFGVGSPQTGMSHCGAAPLGLPRTRCSAGTTAPTGSQGKLGRVCGKILRWGTPWHSAVFCAAPDSPVASCQPSGIQYISLKKKKKKSQESTFWEVPGPEVRLCCFLSLQVRIAALCGPSARYWTKMYIVWSHSVLIPVLWSCAFIIPIFQVMKQRCREVKTPRLRGSFHTVWPSWGPRQLIQSHSEGHGGSWGNPPSPLQCKQPVLICGTSA